MRKTIDPVNQKAAAAVSADAVFDAIHSVMHRWRAGQYRAARDLPGGLTHLDGKVLGYFARHPGATQKDLAAHSGRDKGQLARLVSGLKDKGLLDARTDEADRRNVRLHATAQGLALHRNLHRRGQRLAERAVAGLAARERELLLALLERVGANLDDAGDSIPATSTKARAIAP